MTEAEQERAAIVAWLNDRPFGWERPTRLWHRIIAAWHILRRGEDAVFGIFKLLAIKVERGDHLK